jgi:hypothetical protein
MKVNFQKSLVIVVLSIVAVAMANAETPSPAHMSGSELRRMERQAHTPEQYLQLASAYRAQQQYFQQQADAEMHEWIRRMQFVNPVWEKYPRPEDSSRNRYEYFRYEAQRMSDHASHYETMAASMMH